MRVTAELRKAGRIGVFGGSFDPVHYGHLVCAEQLRESAGLDAVLFMPVNRQPHKPSRALTEPAHRLAMLRAATRGRRAFLVSDLEIRRGGMSFSSDTVLELRSLLGKRAELWLMLGVDAFLDLPRWKRPDLLLAECRFAVATRPGFAALAQVRRAVGRSIASRCRFVEVTPLDISSTDIRRRVAGGRSIRYLLPGAVESYIRKRGLYA